MEKSTNSNILKIYVSKPMPFAGIDVEEFKEELLKAYSEGHYISQIGYLHGKVESEMGYDIGVCANSEIYIDLKTGKIRTGIYTVNAVNYDNECVAYIWETPNGKYNCLIVDTNDEESRKYALHNYQIRAINL